MIIQVIRITLTMICKLFPSFLILNKELSYKNRVTSFDTTKSPAANRRLASKWILDDLEMLVLPTTVLLQIAKGQKSTNAVKIAYTKLLQSTSRKRDYALESMKRYLKTRIYEKPVRASL
uniref:Uncharacterized protein n=1 Tax=Romanomermis culicivorax TaxID=13658 RepID=A0A915JU87_ROMCU